jgi:hypothetical protein
MKFLSPSNLLFPGKNLSYIVADSFLITLMSCTVQVGLPAGNLSVSLVLLVLTSLADLIRSKSNSHSFESNLLLV